MANYNPSIVDWSQRRDPDGTTAVIAEMLSQCNTVIKDMIYQEANMPTAHKTTVRVGLPQGTWRGFNEGVSGTKSLTAQFQDSIGMLDDYSYVDKALADLQNDAAKFRFSEDMAHIEGISQQLATAIFYSNEATNPKAFTGMSPRYNTISTSTAKVARNVIDGGGTGSSNISIWLMGWGDNSTFTIFPKGSKVGIQYEDKGDVVPQYDASGRRYEAYTSYFSLKAGICVKDWRYNVRIANLDSTTTAGGLASTTPPDLFALLSLAVNRVPTAPARVSGITESDAPGDPVPGVQNVIYVNRTGRSYMDIQAIRDKNVLISMDDFAGQPVMAFRQVPIHVVDALTTTEATIS